MNFGEARALTTQIYYTCVEKHDLDDRQFNIVVNSMNRKYWRDAVMGIGSLLAKDSADLNTDGSGSFDFSGTLLDPNGVHQILAVELKFLGRYIHMEYIIPQDRYQYNLAFGQVQALIPSAYTLIGEKVLLLPKIAGSVQLRITYIPGLADLSSSSDQLLGGFLKQFHENIPYEAAAILVPKKADDAKPIISLAQDLRTQWKTYLQSRQRQDGRTIRNVPWD